MRKSNPLNCFPGNRINHPAGVGICDLTSEKKDQGEPEKNDGKRDSGKSVESALLELCREIAGTLLRGIQEGQNPSRLRANLCADLRRVGGFSMEQSEGLVGLAIELIRAKSSGEYKRDSSGICSLVAKALGETNSEGLN